MADSSTQQGGLTFSSLLLIAFIVLKLTHVIDWPWIWVLAPAWIGLALLLVIVLVFLGVIGVAKAVKAVRR